jgi:serine/threonine-protein kinase RsbW
MAEELEITIASHPRWLRLVRQVVLEFARECGFGDKDARAIVLAVGEAVGNVLKHSYKGDTGRTFSLACRSSEGGLELELRDVGTPFEPEKIPELPPDEVRPGGRGLFLMREIMDEVEYSRVNGENIVRLRKRTN